MKTTNRSMRGISRKSVRRERDLPRARPGGPRKGQGRPPRPSAPGVDASFEEKREFLNFGPARKVYDFLQTLPRTPDGCVVAPRNVIVEGTNYTSRHVSRGLSSLRAVGFIASAGRGKPQVYHYRILGPALF